MRAFNCSKMMVMAALILVGLATASSAAAYSWVATYPAMGNCTPARWSGTKLDGAGFYNDYTTLASPLWLYCSVKRTTEYDWDDIYSARIYVRNYNTSSDTWARMYYRSIYTGATYGGSKNYSTSSGSDYINAYAPSGYNWASTSYAAFVKIELPTQTGVVGYKLYRK